MRDSCVKVLHNIWVKALHAALLFGSGIPPQKGGTISALGLAARGSLSHCPDVRGLRAIGCSGQALQDLACFVVSVPVTVFAAPFHLLATCAKKRCLIRERLDTFRPGKPATFFIKREPVLSSLQSIQSGGGGDKTLRPRSRTQHKV